MEKRRRRNWARLIAKVWLEDPTLCKRCGKEMKILSAISSPAQDEVMEKLTGRAVNGTQHDEEGGLRGKRGRPARGPPPVGPCPAVTQLDVEFDRNVRLPGDDDNVQFVDPPHRDDDWLDEPEGSWPGAIAES